MAVRSPGTLLQFEPLAPLLPGGEVPFGQIRSGKYAVRFARSPEEVELALSLRFKVFNLEFGEGPANSFRTGRDEDKFDSTSHHLILIDQPRRQVIGACRVRTYEIAKTIEGFYSPTKFDLGTLPLDVPAQAIEFGRACIARPYRNTEALLLLWKGLALYALHHQKKYLFCCCSLSSQDPTEGGRVFDLVSAAGHLHEEFRVNARSGFKCLWYKPHAYHRSDVVVPHQLQTYLRLGAKLCGPPAMDRHLRTIDFFVVLDVNRIDRSVRRLLFTSLEERHEFARPA